MRGLGKALGVDIMEETSQRGSGGSVQQVVARPYFYGTVPNIIHEKFPTIDAIKDRRSCRCGIDSGGEDISYLH